MAKKKIDLNKTKIADGSLRSPKSVYEIIGLNDSVFPTQNYEEYQKIINNMNTIDLVDHAYKIGVVAS